MEVSGITFPTDRRMAGQFGLTKWSLCFWQILLVRLLLFCNVFDVRCQFCFISAVFCVFLFALLNLIICDCSKSIILAFVECNVWLSCK